MPAGLRAVQRRHRRGGWYPQILGTDLKAWWDASQITGKNDGDAITSQTDNSGNVHTMTGTGTGRPLYKTGITNGLPVVRYDGINDFLACSLATSQPLTFAYTFQHRGAFPATTQEDHIGAGAFVGTSIKNNAGDLIGFNAGTGVDGTVHFSADTWYSVIAVFNGASSALYVDGSAAGTGNPGTGGPTTLFAIGGRNTGSQCSMIDIGEMIVGTTAWDAGTIAGAAVYLARWT